MRNSLMTISFLLVVLIGSAQNWPLDPTNGKISFSEVVNIDSITKDQLYLKAMQWFAETYNDSKEVIQLSDKENGVIVGKAVFKVYFKSIGVGNDAGLVNYTISIKVKDNKFKYEITDIYHDNRGADSGLGSGGDLLNEKPACGNFLLNKKIWAGIKDSSYNYCINLSESIKEYMLKKNKVVDTGW